MSCRVEARLGPYLEGELTPDERRSVELHLEGCEPCSQVLGELRATVDLLRLVPEPLEPPELGRLVMGRIAAGESRSWTRWSAWVLGGGGPLPAALGALAAAALVVLVLRTVVPSETPWTAASLALAPAPGPAPVDDPSGSAFDAGAAHSSARLPSVPLRQAATGARSLPAQLRPRPERAGGMGVGAAAPLEVQILPPRPALARCQAFGSDAGAEAGRFGFDCRPWLSGMLTLGQLDPQRFLGEVRTLPEAERDAWLGELVGFAARSGSAARVAAGLRASAEPAALPLADRFERGTRTASSE